jgi:FkbM family methyltransferase
MSSFRNIAQKIRHLPGLESVNGLWDLLRTPYHNLLDIYGEGVKISVGGIAPARIPPIYAGNLWESYEPESIQVFTDWLKGHPDALVLDVGCAIGIYSLVALFTSEKTEVIAFDPDWASLKASQRMCQYAKGNRLQLVRGFVGNEHISGKSLETVVSETANNLNSNLITGNPGTTAYICIDSNDDPTIPVYSLDELLGQIPNQRPILLKCDVEGAELLVLQGVNKLLENNSLAILLSVHPPMLGSYGHSVEGVRHYLQGAGYKIELIAKDHEEHWWCEKHN